MKILLTIALALMLNSCASIVSKSDYSVHITSNPTGAALCVKNNKGISIFEGKTPATLTLASGDGYFGSASYQLEYSKPGYYPQKATLNTGFDGWYIGNILFGGVIGFLAVDPATGAMWDLPDSYVINLNKNNEPTERF